MTNTETKHNDPEILNGYALPDGRVLSMPAHMTGACEFFTLADGTVVTAVRVDNDQQAPAWRLAVELERRRLALKAKLGR